MIEVEDQLGKLINFEEIRNERRSSVVGKSAEELNKDLVLAGGTLSMRFANG